MQRPTLTTDISTTNHGTQNRKNRRSTAIPASLQPHKLSFQSDLWHRVASSWALPYNSSLIDILI